MALAYKLKRRVSCVQLNDNQALEKLRQSMTNKLELPGNVPHYFDRRGSGGAPGMPSCVELEILTQGRGALGEKSGK